MSKSRIDDEVFKKPLREHNDEMYYHPIMLFGKDKAKYRTTYTGITDPLIGAELPVKPIKIRS